VILGRTQFILNQMFDLLKQETDLSKVTTGSLMHFIQRDMDEQKAEEFKSQS
jgi:hypothetical protein